MNEFNLDQKNEAKYLKVSEIEYCGVRTMLIKTPISFNAYIFDKGLNIVGKLNFNVGTDNLTASLDCYDVIDKLLAEGKLK